MYNGDMQMLYRNNKKQRRSRIGIFVQVLWFEALGYLETLLITCVLLNLLFFLVPVSIFGSTDFFRPTDEMHER